MKRARRKERTKRGRREMRVHEQQKKSFEMVWGTSGVNDQGMK